MVPQTDLSKIACFILTSHLMILNLPELVMERMELVLVCRVHFRCLLLNITNDV